MPGEQVFRLKCSGSAQKFYVGLVLALMPVWCLLSPFFAFRQECVMWGHNASSQWLFGLTWQQLCLAGFLLAGAAAWIQKRSVLEVSSNTVRLPFWKSMSTGDLTRVGLHSVVETGRPTEYILRFEFSSGEKRDLPLKLITRQQGRQLLSALEMHSSPSIGLATRDYFFSEEHTEVSLDQTVELRYGGNNSFFGLMKEQWPRLLRSWEWLWLLVLIAQAPFMLATLTHALGLTAFSNALTRPLLFVQYQEFFFNCCKDLCLDRVASYAGIFKADFANYLVLMLAALTSVPLIMSFSRPDKLRLTGDGLTLLSREKVISSLQWRTVTAVQSYVSPKTGEREIRFQKNYETLMCLPLSEISSAMDQRTLIRAVEQFAPLATIDAELMDTCQPEHKRSYTELWLQSLSGAPKRERLTPLQARSTLQNTTYIIQSQLGVGGQGTAYLAHRRKVPSTLEHTVALSQNTGALCQNTERINRETETVVLKEFILPVYVDNEARKQALEKFQGDSQTLQELSHPNIVRLLDYFVEDHRAYLVLEHVEGNTLRQIIEADGALSESAVRDLILQMCTILDYLHGLDPPLVHRDFTPDNLILGHDGSLKLIDFDVARRTNSASKTSVVGKHAFIPPEQFRGRPVIQSDIYAMGATVYFLLTGQEPEPLTQSTMHQVGGVSLEMHGWVARATELDVSSRFNSARDAASVLAGDTCTIKLKDECTIEFA